VGTADEHRSPVIHSKVASLGAKVVPLEECAGRWGLRADEVYEVIGIRPVPRPILLNETLQIELHGLRGQWFYEGHFRLASYQAPYEAAAGHLAAVLPGLAEAQERAAQEFAQDVQENAVRLLLDSNPKTRFGHAKPPLGLVPGAALVHVSEALRDGSDKYGAANWRQDPVTSQTYFDAALRHLFAWQDGEDTDPKSKVHHLAHAATNMMIILDAMEAGTLIDARPPKARTADLIREFTRVG
jgi:hypothetical protein